MKRNRTAAHAARGDGLTLAVNTVNTVNTWLDKYPDTVSAPARSSYWPTPPGPTALRPN